MLDFLNRIIQQLIWSRVQMCVTMQNFINMHVQMVAEIL